MARSIFPHPFGGITQAITIPVTSDAEEIIRRILEEQNKGHYHNFAVEVDHPGGIVIYGSESLMLCIQGMV